MHGETFKKWAGKKELNSKTLAFSLEVSQSTIYKWFLTEKLPKRVELALNAIGCKDSNSK